MPGNKNSRDPFGFNAFPEAPPGADEWEPDPERVPQPGVVKDYRFNRDPDAEARDAARKRQFRQEQMLRASSNNSLDNASGNSVQPQSSVHLNGFWPAPKERASGPPRAPTAVPVSTTAPRSPAAEAVGTIPTDVTSPRNNQVPPQVRAGVDLPPTAYVPPHLRVRSSSKQERAQPTTPSVIDPLPAPHPSLKLPPKIVTSRPNPGISFTVPNGSSPATPAHVENDAWGSSGRRTSDSETLVSGGALGDGLDDEAFAKRAMLKDHGIENEDEGLQLQKHILDQCKVEMPKMMDKTSRDAYIRFSKIREIIWKEEDLKLDLDQRATEQNLIAMESTAFEDYHAHICHQHNHWWDSRYGKAAEIKVKEGELKVAGKIAEKGCHDMEEMLAMDANELSHLYTKVSSAYQQYLKERLATFICEERKKFGVRKASEDIATTMDPKLADSDFYESDSNNGVSGFESDAGAYSNDDDDDDDGFYVYQVSGAAQNGGVW